MATSELNAKYIWDGRSIVYDPQFTGKQITYDQVVEDNQSSYGYQSQSQLGQSQGHIPVYSSTMRSNDQPPLYSQQVSYMEKEPENYQLIDKSLIDTLSLDYYRHKGFLQSKPDELFKYFLEYSLIILSIHYY